MFVKWLNKKNIPNVKQTFLKGAHGWGMGYAYPETTTFPENLFPNNFYNHYYELPINSRGGEDGVNGSYNKQNNTYWFMPPYVNSNLKLSLNEFLNTFFS